MSILESLSKEQLVALLSAIPNNEVVGSQQPSVAEDDERRPISKKWEAGWEIIRLLNSKRIDESAHIGATFSVVFDNGGNLAESQDDYEVTFGDLKFVIPNGATNAKGVSCNDYPNVWRMTWPEAKVVRDELRSFDSIQKPKASGGQPKAKAAQPAKPVADDRLARLEALVQQLAEGQFAQPAKPVVAEGHQKVAKSATPTPNKEISENVVLVLVPGQIVKIDGEFRQVSPDGKRLNKTIA